VVAAMTNDKNIKKAIELSIEDLECAIGGTGSGGTGSQPSTANWVLDTTPCQPLSGQLRSMCFDDKLYYLNKVPAGSK
jgi:hypothetical protein